MSIDVDQETRRLIEDELRSGRFSDAGALVGAAVKHFLVTRQDLGQTRDEIDAMIAQAIDSLERGEGVDGEDFFAELEKAEFEKKDGELQRQRE
jgi:Arc/MetJ-type ribon-helix-helix transcriptional regulator